MTKHRSLRHAPEFPPGSAERGPRALVAVVGRPNVGKSTLFNRLTGTTAAIVHDEPGVTRDRHYADAFVGGRAYTLVDTGGFDPESDDPMKMGIARQVDVAVLEADVVICVFDATTGLVDADRRAVKLLRKSDKPIIYVANKCDSSLTEAEAQDLYRLGVERIIGVSALHGRGMHELDAAIERALPPEAPFEGPAPADDLVRVAIIGKPNAGKSSLVNRLSGAERVLVDDRPGTTRDAIDTLVELGGRRYVLVDTAGIRRKAKVTKEGSVVEAVSVLHAVRAMERCDVVVLMCDAAEGVAEQDAKILGLAVDRGRAVVVALNKSDLLDRDARKRAEEQAKEKLAFAPYAPLHALSVEKNRGVKALLELVTKVHDGYVQRVSTGQLNSFFEEVLKTHPPPTQGGKAPRFYFITQAETRPPLFVVMTNAPESIHWSYHRYVANQLRKRFGFVGVPIRIRYKARRKAWRGKEGPDVEMTDKTS